MRSAVLVQTVLRLGSAPKAWRPSATFCIETQAASHVDDVLWSRSDTILILDLHLLKDDVGALIIAIMQAPELILILGEESQKVFLVYPQAKLGDLANIQVFASHSQWVPREMAGQLDRSNRIHHCLTHRSDVFPVTHTELHANLAMSRCVIDGSPALHARQLILDVALENELLSSYHCGSQTHSP